MANPLPILLLGAGALLLLSGKKKKKKKKSGTNGSGTNGDGNGADSGGGRVLPSADEDMDEEEGTTPIPGPGPAPGPGPRPGPLPIPEPDPGPEPLPGPDPDPVPSSSKPDLGPSGVGSCANQIYNRDPQYMSPDIVVSGKALNLFNDTGYYFYLRGDFQEKLYSYMLQRFQAMKGGQERRTVASVVLREALKHFNSGCEWEVPVDSLGQPEQFVWSSGHRLAVMAQVTADIEDPSSDELFKTGSRYSITRESLGEPDPGFFGAQKKPVPGTRVEVLVTDATQESAEHIIGEVVKLTGPQGEPDMFEIRIIDKFQGTNVSPRLRTKHGFKVGSNVYFSQKGPTGIYRIFPAGMV